MIRQGEGLKMLSHLRKPIPFYKGKIMIKLGVPALFLASLCTQQGFAASDAIESNTVEVTPSVVLFKKPQIGEASKVIKVTFKNIGEETRQVSATTLTGNHSSQYRIITDACTAKSILPEESCDISIEHEAIDRGYKQSILNIFSDSPDTPVLQAFLTNREGKNTESARRLPPVLYSLDVPEQMIAGNTYTIEWSILGYHDSYISSVAMFNCTGVNDGSCGASYTDQTRFFSKVGELLETKSTDWRNGDVYASEYIFSTEFKPNFTEETNIVLRFYRLNGDDKLASGSGLSLIIPGNLSENYYDKQGRRITKTVTPQ